MTKSNIPEINAIKSDRFLLWVAIMTLPLLSSNTYFVYHEISVFKFPYKELVSAGVSFILAGFILLYTIRKNYKMARNYAYFEALISAYYYIMTIGWEWPLLPAFGFVLILPSSLYNATMEIEKGLDDKDQNIDELKNQLIEADEMIEELKKEKADILKQGSEVINELQNQLDNIPVAEDDFNKGHHLEISSEVATLNAAQILALKNNPIEVEKTPNPKTHFWYKDSKGPGPV
jgi:hypothetical protein